MASIDLSMSDDSDDDLPDVPLIQRLARLNPPAAKSDLSSVAIQVSNPSKNVGSANLKTTADCEPKSSFRSVPFEISDDDDDDPIPKKAFKSSNNFNPPAPSSSVSSNLSSSTSSTSVASDKGATSRTAGRTSKPPSSAKLEEKRKKEEEKLRKKLEKEREAAAKKADAQRKKALKPGEAHKCIVVDIDTKLLEAPIGGFLLQEIQNLGAATQIEPHPAGLTDTIFFWRRDPASAVEEGDENKTLELFCIVYLTAKEFISLVANGKNEKAGLPPTGATVKTLIAEKTAQLKDVKLTLIIDGIEKHFRNVKTLQNREYRQRVGGQKTGMTALWTDVNRLDFEESKITLQLFHEVHVIEVETKEEMAAAVVRFTKSVAERPHKQMFQGHVGGLFTFCSDSAMTSVKPNSVGEGLLKAWKKQLTQFTQISDDVANAVVAAYSSPQLLRGAFKSSPTPSLLLQDLNIRRGAGPLETSRKVGPELSKRIWQFFTAVDGDQKITM